MYFFKQFLIIVLTRDFRDVTATTDGKTWLSNTLKLCKPLSSSDEVTKLTDWLNDVYSDLAMVNYPYATSFLAPLPAYPVREFCTRMGNLTTGKAVLEHLANALSIYTNFTGQTKCLDINETSSNVVASVWDYQVGSSSLKQIISLIRLRFRLVRR